MTRALLALLACALPFGVALPACAPSPAPGAPSDPGGPSDPGAPIADAPFASEDDYRQQYQRARAELEAAAQTEASDPAACYTVMHSEQACGGLTDWVVVSSESSDTTRVRALAERVTALTRKANAQFEWASTCMAYQAPPVTLRGGRCVAAR